jgi:2-amino-4-hydroxy-6-hydroxymethyldihydropteridine diphosphokinase
MPKAAFSDFAFIALGANLPLHSGNPAATLRAVLPGLQKLSDSPLLVSAFYESDPKDCPPGSPVYINAVTGLVPRAEETPESLLGKLQQLEHEFGRVRSGTTNEARTLDLDLLAFKSENRNTATLTLPHPRAHQRRFVLQPWLALVGAAFPLHGNTLGHWLAENRDPALRTL